MLPLRQLIISSAAELPKEKYLTKFAEKEVPSLNYLKLIYEHLWLYNWEPARGIYIIHILFIHYLYIIYI